MKSNDKRQQAPSIVEDGAIENLKKSARDLGLIVNAGQKRGTVASQTKTTLKLDKSVKRGVGKELSDGKKGGKK